MKGHAFPDTRGKPRPARCFHRRTSLSADRQAASATPARAGEQESSRAGEKAKNACKSGPLANQRKCGARFRRAWRNSDRNPWAKAHPTKVTPADKPVCRQAGRQCHKKSKSKSKSVSRTGAECAEKTFQTGVARITRNPGGEQEGARRCPRRLSAPRSQEDPRPGGGSPRFENRSAPACPPGGEPRQQVVAAILKREGTLRSPDHRRG